MTAPHHTSPLRDDELAALSALVDLELDRDELLAAVDLIANEPEARDFYRAARGLDGLLQATGQRPHAERPSRDLWQRIVEAAAERPQAPPATPRRWWAPAPSRWLLAATLAAIALALVLALRVTDPTLTPRPGGATPDPAPVIAEVELGSRPERMSDDRFLDLATELLEADRRYQREMLELLQMTEQPPMVERASQEWRPVVESERAGKGAERSSSASRGRRNDASITVH